MKGEWRDFFYFSKADRRVLLLLVGVLLGIVLSVCCFLWLTPEADERKEEEDSGRYAALLKQLQADSVADVRHDVVYAQEKEREPETFFFDPNTADSTELLRLGLTPWQVRNIYKYRAKGGRYHRPEDFARLYGLTKGDYDRLRPYIRIADEYRLMSDLYPQGMPVRDTLERRPRQEKFEEGVQVELNSADTTVLKKIPGIGPYYARKIVNYRMRLGGFVAVEQLAEVEGLPAGIERWFTVIPDVTHPLFVNRLSVDALRRHPYLNFYQSRVIVEHRRKYGPIKKLQALSLYEEFTPADLERLQPYVSFEE